MARVRVPNHGGSRPGAGRPSDEPLQPVRLRLSMADLALANAIGAGNRTEGIRLALRAFGAAQKILRAKP